MTWFMPLPSSLCSVPLREFSFGLQSKGKKNTDEMIEQVLHIAVHDHRYEGQAFLGSFFFQGMQANLA